MMVLCLPSGFKPAVENFLHTLQFTLAHLRRDSQMINMFAVNVRESSGTSQLLEFGNGADTDNLFPY
jgi:hypothetical protein